MSQDDSYRLARVGAFVTIATVTLVVVIALLSGSRSLFTKKARLHTQFNNTSGLVVGAPVRLAGVDIGIVQSIHFESDAQVKKVHVVLGVQSKYLDRIRADSVAHLSSKGLLGDMMVNLTVGSPEFPALRSGSTVKSEESDGLTEVVASVQEGIVAVRQLVNQVDQRLKVVLSDDVAHDLGRALSSTANILHGVEHGKGLVHDVVYNPELAQHVVRLTAEAQQAAAQLSKASRRVDSLLSALETGTGTLHGLIYKDDGTKLVAELQRAATDLAVITTEVRRGAGPLHSLVYADKSNLVADLSTAAHLLATLMTEIAQGKGTIGGLLKDPSIYEDLKLTLGKVQRNVLLKAVIRSAIRSEGLQRETAAQKP